MKGRYKRSVARKITQHFQHTVRTTVKIKKKRVLRDDTAPLFEQPKTIAEIALKHVEIWTDGGCWPNPGGPGAWAAVIKFGEHRKEMSGPVEAPTTNNRCELLAVIEALKQIKQVVRITLHTDSMYVIHVLQSKKPSKLKNQDLVVIARELAQGHALTPIWVKGHNGDPENECCDRLCNSHQKAGERFHYSAEPQPKTIKEFSAKVERHPSHHTLENDEARRERDRLQMEVDRAMGF